MDLQCFCGPIVDLPENPDYTIFDSIADSVRFVRESCLTEYNGHACVASNFVNEKAEPQLWHEFGPLEGPGWAANTVGGAHELYRFGRFTRDETLMALSISLLDHVLEDGFIDFDTGYVYGYRHTGTDMRSSNYLANDDWFCPGSMARVGHQLLTFSHDIEDGRRKDFMRRASSLMASWIVTNIRSTDNGWWPRYCAIDGSWTREDDEFFDYSADGLFIIDLLTDLVRGGDEQYRPLVIEKAATFLESGGLFASINHDTFDRQECVSYAVAFRTLRRVADLVGDDELRRFAYDTALAGLARFRLTEDHNGVATKGLLYMEDSWDTSYLWENAHSALAYFEAASECEEYRREYSLAGLTILRAISRHHYGDLVFLTEGIDWNNHVGAQHHFGDETYGAIQYTEPLLNNLHIVAPTLYYLENLATQRTDANRVDFVDCDDNVLTSRDRL